MLNKQELANFLTSKLNEIGNGIEFDIKTEVGEVINNGKINGILLTTGADNTPIADFTEAHYNFVVTLLVPSAKTNKNFLKVDAVVGEFAKDYNGKQQDFGTDKGTLEISLGKPDNFAVDFETGETVPLYFTIKMLYTEGASTSSQRHWFLKKETDTDFVEIPYMVEEAFTQDEGIVRKLNGKDYNEAVKTGRTLYYRFEFPYDKKNAICKALQKDLLSGDFTNRYDLKFYEGQEFTSENPFVAKVSIAPAQTSSIRGEKTKTAKMVITFVNVANTNDYAYYLGLFDNQFDLQSEDTRWFDSQAEQQAYYEAKVVGGTGWEEIKSVNLDSIDVTTQISSSANTDVFNKANKNYAVIKVEKGTAGQTGYEKRYFYYQVTNAMIGAKNQIQYQLKLDTVQTYLFDENLRFGDSYIEKSNLNRWVDNGDGTVSFDGTVNSKLFEREELQNVAKRLTKRTKVGFYDKNTDYGRWCNTNILGWCYVYVQTSSSNSTSTTDKSPKYSFNKLDPGSLQPFEVEMPTTKCHANFNNEAILPLNTSILVFPIMKLYSQIILRYDYKDTSLQGNQLQVLWGFDERNNKNFGILDQFAQLNNGFTKVMCVKVSPYPPQELTLSEGRYEIKNPTIIPFDLNTKLLVDCTRKKDGTTLKEGLMNPFVTSTIDTLAGDTSTEEGNTFLVTNPVRKSGATSTTPYTALGISYLSWFFGTEGLYTDNEYEVDKELTFNKADIVGDDKDPKYNPKLLGSDYFSLKLGDETEMGFEYDLQKLNNNKLYIYYSDSKTPDFAKTYIRFKDSGLYNNGSDRNLTGFVGSNDNTMILSTTAYQQMLAQNKNYFTQNFVNTAVDTVSGLVNIGKGALAGGIGAKFAGTQNSKVLQEVGTSIGALGGSIGVATGIAKSIINENFTVDNLINSPNNIQCAKGNAIFQNSYSESGIIVEEYDILPNEKNMVNDYMVKYGYTTNLIGNPFDYLNNSINGRKYFNYIKANIDAIGGVAMSNTARADLRQRFANGLRFWNTDDISYNKENYENWLLSPTLKVATTSTQPAWYSVTYNGKSYRPSADNRNVEISSSDFTGEFIIEADEGKYINFVGAIGELTVTSLEGGKKLKCTYNVRDRTETGLIQIDIMPRG